jgi:hypothetical protein
MRSVPDVSDLKKSPSRSHITRHYAVKRDQRYLASLDTVDVAVPGEVFLRAKFAAVRNRAEDDILEQIQ